MENDKNDHPLAIYIGMPHHLGISPLIPGMGTKIPLEKVADKNFFINDNIFALQSNSLLHTRKAFSNSVLYLIPMVKGKFLLKASVICKELEEPEILEYEVEVV